MAGVPSTARDLRDWFRDLKEASGLSYAEIAAALGEEERNVKRWMTVSGEPVIPRGDVVLRLLSTFGVRFDPPAPGSVRALNDQIGEMRTLLATVDLIVESARSTEAAAAAGGAEETAPPTLLALEAKVDGMAQATAEALASLASAIAELSDRLPEAAFDSRHQTADRRPRR